MIMNHKGFSIIIIPLVVLLLAVAGVFAYKLYSDGVKSQAAQESPAILKTIPSLQGAAAKPVKGYGSVKEPTKSATPSVTLQPTGSTVSGTPLETFLEETEDTGEAELKSLDATASANL